MSLVLVAAAPLVLMIFGAGGWFTTYGIAGKVMLFRKFWKKIPKNFATLEKSNEPPTYCTITTRLAYNLKHWVVSPRVLRV